MEPFIKYATPFLFTFSPHCHEVSQLITLLQKYVLKLSNMNPLLNTNKFRGSSSHGEAKCSSMVYMTYGHVDTTSGNMGALVLVTARYMIIRIHTMVCIQ